MCLFNRRKHYEDDPEVLAAVQRFIHRYLSFEINKPEYFRHKLIVIDNTKIEFDWRCVGDLTFECRNVHVKTTNDKEDLLDIIQSEYDFLRMMSAPGRIR